MACGTGDLTVALAQELWHLQFAFETKTRKAPLIAMPPVIGIDFTFEMLPFARPKGHFEICGADEEHGLWDGDYDGIRWINGDAQSLPLPNESADVVSIAFGIRNVQDPFAAIKEFHRILRPGGRAIILEFSLPTNAILRGLYNFYFRQILPRTATWISRDKTGAYKYLPQSVNTFIGRAQMMSMMRDAGFERVEQYPMTFGVCVCYRGLKAGD